MLILFDIDMTLLQSKHVGVSCLRDAGRELFDQDFSVEGIRFGGGLDPVIIKEMLEKNNVAPTLSNINSMRSNYHRLLDLLSQSQQVATPLPGAHELVNATSSHDSNPTIGLLTGNFQETGIIKVKSAGFDPELFTINAWGDSSPHENPIRSHLPPVAIENYRQVKNIDLDPQSVIIIGDTIHDVACAIDSGCRSLAVATGHDTSDTLKAAGAHRVIDDLTKTEEIIEWIMNDSLQQSNL